MNRKDIVKLQWPNKTIVGYDAATDTITWNTLDTSPNPSNAELDAAIAAYNAANTFLPTNQIGSANGAAALGADGKVPPGQIPSTLATGLVVDGGGCLTLLNTAVPDVPAIDRCAFYSIDLAGRNFPAFKNNVGATMALQSNLASCNAGSWTPNGNNTAVNSFGITAPSSTGTATARSVATTNLFTSTRRIGYVSASSTGSSCGVRLPALQFWRGNAAGLGGFFFSSRFGVSDASAVATPRMFVGMYGSASAIGNVQPTTLLNTIGVGCDAGEAVLKMIWNDSASTASTLSLGANFPTNTLSTDLYEFNLYAPSNASYVNYQVINLRTGSVAEGQLTTNIPAATQLLAPHFWRNNGTTAKAVGLDLVSLYIETDY